MRFTTTLQAHCSACKRILELTDVPLSESSIREPRAGGPDPFEPTYLFVSGRLIRQRLRDLGWQVDYRTATCPGCVHPKGA